MADETLLTASRRVVRFYGIDMRHGGLYSRNTEEAVHILNKMVLTAVARDKAREQNMEEMG